MDKLKLDEILRYLTIGYVIFAVLYYCERPWVTDIFSIVGAAGSLVAAFVIGSLFYLIYRALIYNLILFFVVDRLYSPNVRRTLIQRYTVASYFEADALWKALQNEPRIKDQLPPVNLRSSGIHLLYMTAIVNISGASYLALQCAVAAPLWVMLLVALACGAAAITSDIYVEKQVKLLFTMIGTESVTRVVTEAGYVERRKDERT